MERTQEFEIEIDLDGDTYRVVGSHTQEGNEQDDDFTEWFDFDRIWRIAKKCDPKTGRELSRAEKSILVSKYRPEFEDSVRDYEVALAEDLNIR
jgi:hypothetical protein